MSYYDGGRRTQMPMQSDTNELHATRAEAELVPPEELAQPRPGRLRRSLPFVRTLVSIALLCWVLRKVALTDVVSTLTESVGRWPFLLLAFLLPAIGVFFASCRWQLLLAAQGPWITLERLWKASLVGVFYNQLLPSTVGGDVARAWWVTDLDPPTESAPSRSSTLALNLTVVGVDRFVGLIGICATALLAALMSPSVVKQLPGAWVLFMFAIVGIVSVIPLLYLASAIRRWPLFQRLLPRLHGSVEFICRALSAYREEKSRLCYAFGLSIGLQGLIVLQYWALATALGVPVSIWSLAVVVPVVTLFSLMPLTVNGIGIRENALALLGAPFGISPTVAVVLAYAVVFITLLYACLGGLIHLRGQRGRLSVQELFKARSVPNG